MPSIIRATTTSGLQVAPDNSGSLQLQTNGTTTAVTIDTSQNVGIGTTSPTNYAGAGKVLQVNNSSSLSEIRLTNSSTGSGAGAYGTVFQQNGNDLYIYNGANSFMAFGTNNTERMRIDSSGNVLVGTTTNNSRNPRLALNGNSVTWSVGPSSSNSVFVVYNPSEAGVFLPSGNTSWSSASDETLKENLQPITNAIDKVNTLKTVIGNFIADEEKRKHPFLIAQDVEKVLPEAVTISPEGTLGLSYTDVIPLLVAAIKEQQTIINDLKARIETLEAK